MGMTKETIEKRIIDLQKEQSQMTANLHAVMGAIKDCQFWLTELAKEETPKE